MNFLHFAILMFVVCAAVLVLVSLAAAPMSDERLRGLTFATTPRDAHAVDIAEGTRRGHRVTVAATVALCAVLIALWAVFYVVVPIRAGS
jgi:SSS family solute:Na+ symporter